MADQPSRRRRFQFRLRTLFVIVTILAVECAVCLPMLREWEANRNLTDVIEAKGFYGWPVPENWLGSNRSR